MKVPSTGCTLATAAHGQIKKTEDRTIKHTPTKNTIFRATHTYTTSTTT